MSRIPHYLKERIQEINNRTLLYNYELQTLPKWEKVVVTWTTLFLFWMIISASVELQNVLIGIVITFIVSTIMYNMLTHDIRRKGNVFVKASRLILLYLP
ncbi:MAG: cation:proton antiporter, partial [Thermoplasmata archaeon]